MNVLINPVAEGSLALSPDVVVNHGPDRAVMPIIYMPHLLGFRQRLGALLFSLCCWLYFLIPVTILGGWLAGYRELANEVVMLGGWKKFQHLMDVSGKTILILLGMWLAWTVYLVLQRGRIAAPPQMVDDAALCRYFGIGRRELDEYRRAQLTTIHFDDDGSYRSLEAGAIAAHGDRDA